MYRETLVCIRALSAQPRCRCLVHSELYSYKIVDLFLRTLGRIRSGPLNPVFTTKLLQQIQENMGTSLKNINFGYLRI